MPKDPNVSKPAAKKPAAPKLNPTGEAVEVNGKSVRTDTPGTPKSKPGAGPAPERKPTGSGKVGPKEVPTSVTLPIESGTVEFGLPQDESDPEAVAAAFISREFSDDEPAASDMHNDTPIDGATQAFAGDTLDADLPSSQGAPPDGATQAFAGDTLDTEMPKLVEDQPLEGGTTQAFTGDTIDTRKPIKRPPAPAPKPVAAAGAQKGTPMVTMLGNRYKLLKKLGQGGMGSVYKAHEVKLDRVVAIKVLAKELAGKEGYVQRFEREARVMIKIDDHPNILRCFDADMDQDKGLHYLVMEFVEGGSVEGWLKKLGKFSIGDALHIILKTAAGLQYAHSKSLIHRDVKPDNILLTKEGVIKVADLGLAKDTEEDTSLTKTGAGAGTPIYMAPEQARDVKHVDARVDIYALGVMLYVFLTGQPPFSGSTLVELISAKEKGKFDPMRKHNDEVPSKLDLIVDKMIARDPKNRYASCQDVIDDIEPLGLANDELSFIESSGGPANGKTIAPGPKAAKTSGPAKVVAKTSVGGAGKGPAAKTTGPAAPAGTTSVPQDEEEPETDIWYWTLVTQSGKEVTKKLTTEQLRTLIKAGHLDAKAQISKTENGSCRAAATFPEFQAIFKSLKTATKANVKGAKYRDKYKEIEEEDARRRKYGWISRMFKSFGSTIFGLLWIVLILAIVGAAGYFGYMYMNP